MRARVFGVIVLLLCTAGCVPPNYQAHTTRTPCRPTISPIRYKALLATLNFNFTYTPRDASEGRDALRDTALRELNSQGSGDGNTFTQPNGQEENFTLTYSLSNDGQDHYTGSVELYGWGWGYINTFSRYQYPYSDPLKLTTDLTDDAYVFIHTGWHETQAGCPI